MDLLTITQKLVHKISQYLDAMETGGCNKYSYGFWDGHQQKLGSFMKLMIKQGLIYF